MNHLTGHRSASVTCGGLRLSYTEWGDRSREPCLILHGFLDSGRAWDRVARRLTDNYWVVAPDFRGHGRSDWVGAGGYYHYWDYLLDTDRLLSELSGPSAPRWHVIGHSMGSGIAAALAATRPQRVATVSLVEGVGVADESVSDAPQRLTRWLDEVRADPRGRPRVLASLAAATDRLQHIHSGLDAEFAHELATYLTCPSENGFSWRYDPLHRTRSPKLYRLDEARAVWSAITCPVQLIFGERGFRRLDEASRVGAFPNAALTEVPEAGHNIHFDRPAELAAALAGFLGRYSSVAVP